MSVANPIAYTTASGRGPALALSCYPVERIERYLLANFESLARDAALDEIGRSRARGAYDARVVEALMKLLS